MKLTASSFLIFLFYCGILQAQIKPNGVNSASVTHPAVGVPDGYPAFLNINYVRTWQPNKGINDASTITTTSPVADVQQQTQYIDGLGRPLQTVSKGTTPGMKDMVAPVTYDELGRESYKYLPYTSATGDGSFKINPFSEQAAFMQQQYSPQGETFYYGKTNYEASPLNRATKTMAPGNSWSGSDNGVGMKYWINTPDDDVKMWNVTNNSNEFGSYTVTGPYPAGRLYKSITIDEHGKQVIEFKDKENKVILKKVQLTAAADNGSGSGHPGWLCTYYIYDDVNNLRCVIQPRGVELITPTWTLTDATILSEQCFRYEYDGKNRMITKKVPGAAEMYMLYDKRDRLVFSQDGNMRPDNRWMTTLYDALNRPVLTAITVATRTQLEAALSAEFASATLTTQGSTGTADLNVYNYVTAATSYQASNSITFNPGFESGTGANFTAEIVNTATSPQNIEVYGNPIPSGATFYALTLTYYDSYAATQKTYSTADNAKLGAGNNPYPEALPSSNSSLTKGIATSGKVWVLEDPNDLSKGRWLETVTFFDDKGRPVQVQSDNYKGGLEKVTNLYDFTGKTLCTYTVHNNPASSVGAIRIKTNIDYDHAGRLLTITKQLNDAGTGKVIVQNEYDELGQLKNKKLGSNPLSTSDPLETLAYEYNIRGWMKAINKDYVNNTSNANYFGQTLSYDYGFTSQQLNGNIAGAQWRSKGDGEQRAFGYDYDAANRILKADFTQNTGGWNTTAGVDFSVKMGDGSDPLSAYDANGNIKKMQQWGLKLNASTQIDDLTYSYVSNSNKLQAVNDAIIADNKLGDFTDKNTTATDYTYDDNGNLKKDLNKDIGTATADGIIYNHLNLPAKITVANKGTIEYLYDAAGNKLEKKTIDNTVTSSKTTITSYINGFVYENDALQFTGHEEGRIRYVPANSNNCTSTPDHFAFDYFIKDHLGNVRVVLTDELKTDPYPVASLETNTLTNEKQYYTIPDDASVRVNKNTVSGYPSDTYTNPNDFVHKLNGNGTKAGSSIVLKVMAGDRFNIRANSWYKLNGSTPGTPVSPLTELLNALTGNVATLSNKVTSTGLTSDGSLLSGVTSFLSNQNSNNYNTAKPKAYLTWILFDEQFKYVSSSSGSEQVGGDQVFTTHVKDNMPVDKNGYLYVYVSNETPNIDVYFDNLQVTHVRGPLLEENHYYPFGLLMRNISYKAAGGVQNRKKFNDGTELQSEEFSDGSGLELYATQFRSLDPQIGRFWQIDPLDGLSHNSSLYAYANNNPILLNDPLGLKGDTAWKKLQEVVVVSHKKKEGPKADETKKEPVNWLNYPVSTPQMRRQWDIDQANFRRGDLRGLTTMQIDMYEQWKQNDQDYRTMSLGALLILASPLILEISPELLALAQEGSTALNVAVRGLGIDTHAFLNLFANKIITSGLRGLLRVLPVSISTAKLIINLSNKPMNVAEAKSLYQVLKFVLEKQGYKGLPSNSATFFPEVKMPGK